MNERTAHFFCFFIWLDNCTWWSETQEVDLLQIKKKHGDSRSLVELSLNHRNPKAVLQITRHFITKWDKNVDHFKADIS